MALLSVRDLVKGYRNPAGTLTPIVHVKSFDLPPGSQLALSGESGSGKTTLLHLIAGIVKPDSGRIELNGVDLVTLRESARDRFRATSIGYIFQTFNLLQGHTCLDNILIGMSFGHGADVPRARSLLQRVGLGERMNHYPRQLSTGQQQRVAVARALAGKPCLVLADEPTGNLDSVNAQEVTRLIREVCKENQAALLLVSHDPTVLAAFEHKLPLAQINQVGAGSEVGAGRGA